VCYGREQGKPRGTPTVADGLLYYESNLAVLYCLDATNGQQKWSVDATKFGDASPGTGGVSASPLLKGDLVIVPALSKADDIPSFLAFNRKSGALAWKGNLGKCPREKGWSNDHASPILIDTGHKRIAVNQLFYAVAAVDADTGKALWWIKTDSNPRTQPIYNEKYLFLLGSKMLKIRLDGKYDLLWQGKIRVSEYNVVYSHTVIKDDRLYALCGSVARKGKGQPVELEKVDAETGRTIARRPAGFGGTIVMAQGMLYLVDNRPRVTLLKPVKQGLQEVSHFRHSLGTTHQLYTHAAVGGGRLVLRYQTDAYVYDVRAGK
jgi:outer membrane protein assembly factor BamB